jgi:hypothetical protein
MGTDRLVESVLSAVKVVMLRQYKFSASTWGWRTFGMRDPLLLFLVILERTNGQTEELEFVRTRAIYTLGF